MKMEMVFKWFKNFKKNKEKKKEKMKDSSVFNESGGTENQKEEEEKMEMKNERVRNMGKLFVGGLSYETSRKELENYFSRFGKILDCFIPKPKNWKFQCHAFVTFSSSKEAKAALEKEIHILKGRLIEVKPYKEQKKKKPRVFLGNLPYDITEETLIEFFSRYGEVVDVFIPHDKNTKKSKGYGFLSFKDESSVDKCEKEGFVFLRGRRVQIKKAFERDLFKSNDSSGKCSFPENNFYESLDEETEGNEDSIGSEEEFIENLLVQKFFENYFLEKLSRINEMEDKKETKESFEITEVERLLADFLTISNNTEGACGPDLMEFSHEETDSEKETNEGCFGAQNSETNSKKSTVSKPVVDDSERLIIQKSMPLQIRNKEGFLMCSLCQWISPNDSSESFLVHCKTSTHRTKLKDRFPCDETKSSKIKTTKQIPKTGPNKCAIEDEKKNQNKGKKEPTATKKVNKETESKKKQEKTVNNPKIYALAKGMTSIQPFSKDELVCSLCDKKIPKASELDVLMKNVSTHLESKNHLKKLSEIENSVRNTKKNNNQQEKNQDKKPKKKSKSKNKPKASSTPNEKSDDEGKTKFLCLVCNVLCQSVEVFNIHFSLKSHTDGLSTKNLNANSCLDNMGKCKGCQVYLYGSLYDINKHYSNCV